jgi:P pilus assembly chaperone PapD
MRIHPYFRMLPRVRLYVARPMRAGCISSTSLVLILALLGIVSRLHGQVSAVVQLHGRDAEVKIANPTAHPLRVTLALYRDSVGVNPPLGDSISAVRISPAAFTLQPGAEQTVRLRLHTPPKPATVLRLAVTFLPPEEEQQPRPTMNLVLAVRMIVRVLADGP